MKINVRFRDCKMPSCRRKTSGPIDKHCVKCQKAKMVERYIKNFEKKTEELYEKMAM